MLLPLHVLTPLSVQEPQSAVAYVIGEVSLRGRRPTPEDAVVDQLVAGTWQPPQDGTELEFRGKIHKWRELKPGKDGSFNDDALENGYLSVQVTEREDTTLILNARGDSLVYVNGTPRAGDPYGYGYLNLPIHLPRGRNELLFVAQRGSISYSLQPVEKSCRLQSEDLTLPDVLTSDRQPLYGSVVAVNASNDFVSNLKIRTSDPDGRSIVESVASIPPMSSRKLEFRIPVASSLPIGKNSYTLELIGKGKSLDRITVPIETKRPSDLQRRTFVSNVDGSVQYYAVWPASTPSPSNSLVLTLHGASVEAYGQAAAYAQKSWATIVAPTNRRPYGFDWEGIGRLDALEVLNIAENTYPHDPTKVDLTGHSMGGHGTWSIGTLYPNLFASISPSAGWISFWSYAGGWTPDEKLSTLDLLRRSMNIGDTLTRVDNTLQENVYILHGSVDDNVPVEQARTMKSVLESIHHPHLQYHEQPGANHWWGNQCVDWPPIFENIQDSRLDLDRNHIDFTTPDPSATSTYDWVTVDEQEKSLVPSHVIADRSADGTITIESSNVSAITLSNLHHGQSIAINGFPISHVHPVHGRVTLKRFGQSWRSGGLPVSDKSPLRGGPFKQVFNHRFLFVVGTGGGAEESQWALSRAIYYSESMEYRGNGSVDIVMDRDFSAQKYPNRNVILFGNQTTNSAWSTLMSKYPIQVKDNIASVGDQKSFESADIGGLLLAPRVGESQTLVGAITGTGLAGLRSTDRLLLFSSGVDYPDWILFSPKSAEKVLADGFLSNDWKLDPSQSAGIGN